MCGAVRCVVRARKTYRLSTATVDVRGGCTFMQDLSHERCSSRIAGRGLAASVIEQVARPGLMGEQSKLFPGVHV